MREYDQAAQKEHVELQNRVEELEVIVQQMALLLVDVIPPAYAEDMKLLFVPQQPNSKD